MPVYSHLPNSERLDKRLDRVLDPDVIIPEIYFKSLRATDPSELEKKLILAVLKDAINLYQRLLSRLAKGSHFQIRDRYLLQECER